MTTNSWKCFNPIMSLKRRIMQFRIMVSCHVNQIMISFNSWFSSWQMNHNNHDYHDKYNVYKILTDKIIRYMIFNQINDMTNNNGVYQIMAIKKQNNMEIINKTWSPSIKPMNSMTSNDLSKSREPWIKWNRDSLTQITFEYKSTSLKERITDWIK